MIRATAAFALLAISAASAQAGDPIVRVAASGDGPVLVGQEIEVRVQVLAPNYFMSSVEFPSLDAADAIVTLPEQRASNSMERIGEETYASVAKAYRVTPLAAGTVTLPASEITFAYASKPGVATRASLTVPATRITTVDPPGSTGAQALPVAPLAVVQTLDRDAAGLMALRVGDVLIRTVTVTAEGARAMLIPPPAFMAPDGIQVHRAPPVLEDQGTRGRRTEVVTYVLLAAGEFTLPAVAVDWYDASAGRTRTARAEAIDLTVASAPASDLAIPPEPDAVSEQPRRERGHATTVIAAAIVAVCTLVCGRLIAPIVRRRIHAWRDRRRLSEAEAFRHVALAVRRGDRAGAYRALSAWVLRAGHPSLRDWMRSAASPALRNAVDAIERDLFSAPPASGRWTDGRDLLAAATASRSHARSTRATRRRSGRSLPPLNPMLP